MFRRHAAGVGGYVIARTGDPELAEVITSRVFTLVVRKFHQCGEGQGAQTAWLWAIVRNELARYFRDRKHHASLGDNAAQNTAAADAEPDEALLRQEMHEQLHDAMGRLSDEQQQILYMKYFQNLPNKQIAEALAITPSNVGVKVHRVLKVLRELLGDINLPVSDKTVEILGRGDHRGEIRNERST